MSKTEDIHRAILAKAAQPAAPRTPVAPGARPYVAEAGQRLAQGLQDENQRLKAERSAGMVLLRLDPKKIGTTEFANRHAFSLQDADDDYRRLKESIRRHGQDEPVSVRPAAPGSGFEYELIKGHRRHHACLELDRETEAGFRILARLDESASDVQQLVLKMHRENRDRKDLSAYEQGAMWQSWLNAGIFATHTELAGAVDEQENTVSKYIQIAALPPEVLAAFGDPRTIALRWGQDLRRVLKSAPQKVIAAAEKLAQTEPRPSPDAVLRTLVASTESSTRKHSASREEAVKIGGKVAFRIASRDGRVSLKFGSRVDKTLQRELAEEIKELAETRLKARLKGT